ncbi:MAG: hypothetical protein BEN18_09655 [Epulopiscium sp. Nuni2H_MBin001]|nr:MAG: hypothetical protein BEN18_09655 [Epulopiscium sp. Nuni2H_MBin001]
MMQKLLSTAQTLVVAHDASLSLQIYSPLYSSLLPPPHFLLQYVGQPPSISHGNTHGAVSIIVRVGMMSVNVFGWECHVTLLQVTYTHTHTHTHG